MNNPICESCGNPLESTDMLLAKPEGFPWMCEKCMLRMHHAWLTEHENPAHTINFTEWMKKQDLTRFAQPIGGK